jgi:hypothetical protein
MSAQFERQPWQGLGWFVDVSFVWQGQRYAATSPRLDTFAEAHAVIHRAERVAAQLARIRLGDGQFKGEIRTEDPDPIRLDDVWIP